MSRGPLNRRDFISRLAVTASAWPLAARAQQPERMRLIGVLMAYAESDPEGQAWVAAFREGLQKLGWAEGRNIRIDTRWATPDVEPMQRFAKELVALQPDLILSQSTPTTAALLQQTRTIPIIFADIADPVGSGFVTSFPRPGGNVTGLVLFEPTMAGKWLELLKEIAPRVNRVTFLFNPATATYFEYYMNSFKAAAASFGVEAIVAPVHDRSELESVFAPQAREPNSSLIVMPDSFLNAHRVEITSLAAHYRLLPSIHTVCTLKSVASCPTEMMCSIIIGARPATSTASSRARSRASFRSRPRSSSSWCSTSKPRRRSASRFQTS
jgi:putative ABC transport system substrate-binding protein